MESYISTGFFFFFLYNDLESVITIASVTLNGTTQKVTLAKSLIEYSGQYKFISLELQTNDGSSYYTNASTQYPLKLFIDSVARTIRASYNNGTYYWAGINRYNDTVINVSCSSNFVANAVIRVFN